MPARNEKHAECVMNESRRHQAECGADGSMYVHGMQRRNFQSKPFHVSTAFALLPPRPGSYRDTELSTRGSELLGLQVQGFCCPLQQRPSSGRVTHRVTPQSKGGGDGSLRLLTRAKVRLESRAELGSRSRTGSRAGTSPRGSAVSETTETPTTHCEEDVHHGHPGAAKVNSELHLYLPSSQCEDEEQDAETEEMRSSAEEPGSQESEVKFKQTESHSPVFQDPSHTSGDQTNTGLCNPQHTTGTF